MLTGPRFVPFRAPPPRRSPLARDGRPVHLVRRIVLLVPAVLLPLPGPDTAGPRDGVTAPGKLAFHSDPAARFEFHGPLGERIERSVDRWLLAAPEANPGMFEMFRRRDRQPPPDLVPWAGEFAGKYLASAIETLRVTRSPALDQLVESLVSELAQVQAADGYLGPFPEAQRLLGHWDLWGHYHVLLALLLWHEHTGSAAALETAVRAADRICRTYLGGSRRVLDAGSHEMNMAVIHALGILHRRTGAPRYLELMREIEKDWEQAGDYLRAGLAGLEFFETPRPRWESLHDLQGLVELWRITADERYRTAFTRLWWSIARRDRHTTGGFSSGEEAVGHPWSPAPIETCCTIAWMALTADMLRLEGEPRAADELELATYNAVLGAQHPSGRWWTYNTPMDGHREASAHTIVFQARAGTPELNCCAVNGPRGLGMLSEWAVLVAPGGPVVNFYGPMRARVHLADGRPVEVEVDSRYPFAPGPVEVSLRADEPVVTILRLRIPAWSRETRAALHEGNGGTKELAPVPGSYLEVERSWLPGDRVHLELDDRLRVEAGDLEAAGRIALFRGPLLLAWDPRYNDMDEADLPPLDAAALAGTRPESVEIDRTQRLAPCSLVRLPAARGPPLVLTDFASAGATGARYRTWFQARRAPPPPILLERPRVGERIPSGPILFRWGAWQGSPEVDGYELRIWRPAGGGWEQLVRTVKSRRPWLFLEEPLAPGRHLWQVTARNAWGARKSERREFLVDAAIAPDPEGRREWLEPRADGAILDDPLRGAPQPTWGRVQDATGHEASAGPEGGAGTAVALDGRRGRVRYHVPWFPERQVTVSLWVRIGGFPEGRIGQVFSAWARGMDDPLRITAGGGQLFARLEAGEAYSTAGVPVEAGRWLHVAAVRDGAVLRLHVDGRERGQTRVPEVVRSLARNVALGGNPNFEGNEFLRASVARFQLLARALGPEEIERLAAGVPPAGGDLPPAER